MGQQEACRNDPRQCCQGETPGVQSAQSGRVADHVEGHEGHQAAGKNRRRQRVLRAEQPGIDAVPEIDFDDLDLAVLRSAAARGPGLATSAPEIAEKFKLRPSQVQRSIDKLRQSRMLDTVIGTTDGYGNFRLSPSGAAFVAMWQRQNRA